MKQILFFLLFYSSVSTVYGLNFADSAKVSEVRYHVALSGVWCAGERNPVIWNYSAEVGGFSAFPAEERYQAGDYHTTPKGYLPPFAVQAGLDLISKHKIVSISLGYGRVKTEGDLSPIRFTDMIDPDRGFVKPSRFREGDIRYTYDLLNLDIRLYLGRWTRIQSNPWHVGLGVNVSQVLSSHYQIASVYPAQNKITYFNGTDLRPKDNAASIYPMLCWRYGFEESENDRLSVMMDIGLAFHPVPGEHRDLVFDEFEQTFPIRVGILYNWKTKSTAQ